MFVTRNKRFGGTTILHLDFYISQERKLFGNTVSLLIPVGCTFLKLICCILVEDKTNIIVLKDSYYW